jgi:hypothetical protein
MSGHFGTRYKYIKNKKSEKIINTDENRFYCNVSLPDENGCMNWIGVINKSGYGQHNLLNKKIMRAHRFSYQYFYGNLKDTELVCHKCDNRKCVSPHHLFIGTAQDNMNDMKNKGRNVCFLGSENPNSKLKRKDVLVIREMRRNGNTYKQIADYFNVHIQNIAAIVKNKTWRNI